MSDKAMKRLLRSVTLFGAALWGSAVFLIHSDARPEIALLGGMLTGGPGVLLLVIRRAEKTGRI